MPMQFVVRGARKPRSRPPGVLVHGLSQEEIEAYNAEHPESHRFRTPGKVYENLEYFDTLIEEPSTRFSQTANEEALKKWSCSADDDNSSEVKTELASSTSDTLETDTDKAAAKLQAAQRGHQVRATNQKAAEASQQRRTAAAATQMQAAHRGRQSRLVQDERLAAAVKMQAIERGRQARMMEFERAEIRKNEKKAHSAALKVQAVARGRKVREELKTINEETSRRSSIQLAPNAVESTGASNESAALSTGGEAQTAGLESSTSDRHVLEVDDEAATKLQAITRGHQSRKSTCDSALRVSEVEATAGAAAVVVACKSVEQGTQTGDVEEAAPGPTTAGCDLHTRATAEEPAAEAPLLAANEVVTGDGAARQEITLSDGVQKMLTTLVAEAIKTAVETWAAQKEAENSQRSAVVKVDPVGPAAAPSALTADVPARYNVQKVVAETAANERASIDDMLGAKAGKDQGSQTARPGTMPKDGLGAKSAKDQGSQTARPAKTLASAQKPVVTEAVKPAVHAAAEPVATAAPEAATEMIMEASTESAAEMAKEHSASAATDHAASAAVETVAPAATEELASAAAEEACLTQGSTPAAAAASESAAKNDSAEDPKPADADSTSACPHRQSPPSDGAHPGASPAWELMWSKGIGKGEAFDIGSASGTLVGYLSRTPKLDLAQGATALVPGCGRAYDALALASHGYSRVVALDLSSTAVNAAKEELKTAADTEAAARVEVCCGDFFSYQTVEVCCADFFSYQGQFDLIWDCTFLCALAPSVRAEWAKQQKSLLKPGGLLLTCIFPIVDKEGGPPFAMSVPMVRDLVEAEGFECAELKEQLPEDEQHMKSAFTSAFAAWKKPF